jgi:hypothetical protein
MNRNLIRRMLFLFLLIQKFSRNTNLIPEGVHHILTERTGVLGAVLVGVEPNQYLGAKVFVVQPHFCVFHCRTGTSAKGIFFSLVV